MSFQDRELQKGLIITDNYSNEPILDFISYSNAIVKIIKNSFPNFTLGIFGEWGTGKTTLMKLIEANLEKNKENIITVWFDAWKYENEKQFALIPLLKVINNSIIVKKGDKKDESKNKLKDALKEATIFTLGVSSEIISSFVSNYAGKEAGGLLKRGIESATSRLIPQLKALKDFSDIDSNSIFYNGIKNIQDAIDEIQRSYPGFRFVIFIDDLDRCSEDKILQILESIKIFLSLNGIIYVLGISHDKVVELINKKYQTNNGEQYLKKFIQIPITPAEWNSLEIVNLINYLLDNNIIDDEYKPIITQHKDLIASSLEINPRETKRFLNKLIISYEVFVNIQKLEDEKKKELFLRQLMLIQILNSSWKDLYSQIINSNGKFVAKLKPLVDVNFDVKKIQKEVDSNPNFVFDTEMKQFIKKYNRDTRLLNFLKLSLDTLMQVPDWNVFRRAIKLTEGALVNEALELLGSGRIYEFNLMRSTRNPHIDLYRVNLSGIHLDKVNLSSVTIPGADFRNAFLDEANLNKCKLQGADFTNAKMIMVNLSDVETGGAESPLATFDDADLSQADLTGADVSNSDFKKCKLIRANFTRSKLVDSDFTDADFSGATFIETNFRGAKLEGAKLSNSIIIMPKDFHSQLNEKTEFSGATTDNSEFVAWVSKFSSSIPNMIKNKGELRTILLNRGISDEMIQYLLDTSKLPE